MYNILKTAKMGLIIATFLSVLAYGGAIVIGLKKGFSNTISLIIIAALSSLFVYISYVKQKQWETKKDNSPTSES